MDCSTAGFPVLHHLPKLAQTYVHSINDVIQSFHPLLPSSPPALSFPASRSFPVSQLFTSGGQCWSLSFSTSPSNEYSGLSSFRIDWFDLLAVQGTLKSLLQHHSSKAPVLHCSAFFMVQLSHPYMTTGKTTALTIWTFVGKVMSLLFNMLLRFVILSPMKWKMVEGCRNIQTEDIEVVTMFRAVVCFHTQEPWEEGQGHHCVTLRMCASSLLCPTLCNPMDCSLP